MGTYDIDDVLKQAALVIRFPVAWGEMDALGHVNNAVYFRYLESARVAYIRGLGWKDPAAGSGHLGLGGVGFILQSVQCRFRRPVVFPDELAVTARLVRVETDRFTLSHEVVSLGQREVAAVGEGTIVTYDYANGAKVAIPDGLRAVLLQGA